MLEVAGQSRRPDHIVGDLLLESKVGYQTNRTRIASEVAKDEALMGEGQYRALWLFFGSAVSKSLGPNRALLDNLSDRNVPWIIHPV